MRDPSQPVKVRIGGLLSNDTDPENDTMCLAAVGSALPAGATVTQDAPTAIRNAERERARSLNANF
ncbi:MAG: hypothetical protein WCF18_21465 [Chthoniobacteraceae bacterium]